VRNGDGARTVVVAVAGRDGVVPGPAEGEQVVALRPLAVTAIPPNACPRLLAEPDVAAAVVRGLSEAIRDGRDALAVFGRVSHEARVREKLLQLARAHGKVVSDGVVLELSLKQELVGAMVGSARETVSTALAELTREGFLSRDRRLFKLAVSPDEL
jgi:CRP-like cAMP-binding protein